MQEAADTMLQWLREWIYEAINECGTPHEVVPRMRWWNDVLKENSRYQLNIQVHSGETKWKVKTIFL